MKTLPLLIIDDETSLRTLLTQVLKLEGYDIFQAETAKQGKEILSRERISVVVTDVRLPDANGIELIEDLKTLNPDIEVVVITAFGTIEDGVKAMRSGAFDYITKGDDDDKIILTIEKASEKAALRRQLRDLQRRVESKVEFSKLIGKSESFSKAVELAKMVAQTDTTVLLLGETGTGKELFAEAIHRSSKRRNRPFVAINCSAIPKDLQESELFGHKKGAFTGAISDKIGFFEEADTGTILLDEIGDMTPETQTKLLRSLESRTVTRLGETKPRSVDIRIIAATNANLKLAIEDKHFREDLYYRINGFTIYLPPLRERQDDIELLAMHFIAVFSDSLQKLITGMNDEFKQLIKTHRWTGNIRELKNAIERAVILSSGSILTADLLPEEIQKPGGPASNGSGVRTLDEVEREHTLKVLKLADGNKAQAAKLLGIGTATLYRKLKEFGVE